MLFYSQEKNSDTKEYEVINQEEAKNLGWKQNDLEVGYDAKFYLKGYAPVKPEPTIEERNEAIRQQRANRYLHEVDPLTNQIQRLRDLPVSAETDIEIDRLLIERNQKVDKIHKDLPYIEDTNKEMVLDEVQ